MNEQPEDTTPDIFEPAFGQAGFSLFEKVKIQAQVLVPMLWTFRAEMGEERANQIARQALRQWSEKLFQDIGGQLSGSPRQKWEAFNKALFKQVGDDVDLGVLKQTPDA